MKKLKKTLTYFLTAVLLIGGILGVIWMKRPICPECESQNDVKVAYHRTVTWFGCPSGADILDGFSVGPFIIRETSMLRPDQFTLPKEEYETQMKQVNKIATGWTCSRCKKDLRVQKLN